MRRARWSRHLVIVLSLTAGVALLPGAPARATFPGPNGRIVFWDFMTGQIYAVNPDGTGFVQLTNVPEGRTAADPKWSPDSSHIVFDSDVGGDPRLYVIDAGGGDQHQLVGDHRGFADFSPGYTPNGRKVVYTRCLPDGGCALAAVRSDGTHRHALTPFQQEVFDFGATVSPDGRWITFTRFSAGGVIAQIYVMGSDGSDPQAVTPADLEAFAPGWSPDGRLITFASNCCKANSDVFVMKPDGSGIRALTATEFPANSVSGSYSPEGDQIAFVSDRRYDDLCCVDLFLMRANGTKESLLETPVLGALDPQWGSAPSVASGAAATVVAGDQAARSASRCWGYRTLLPGPCTWST